MPNRSAESGLAEGLAAIPGLPRETLLGRWTDAYGRPPPKGISQRLLEYAAAYHLQARTLGGLRPDVLRKLRRPPPEKTEERRRPARRPRRSCHWDPA